MMLFRNEFVELAFMNRPLAMNLSNHYDEHDALMLGLLGLVAFFHLPKMLPYTQCWEGGFGFSFNEEAVHIQFGRTTKIFTYPWCNWHHARHEIMLQDGTLAKAADTSRGDELLQNVFSETAPYHYLLRNGSVQTTQATYGVEEREWRLKYFEWLPIKRISRCIDVRFAEEVGEDRGSWRGGVLGTGHQMNRAKDGSYETPRNTFQRMMRQRTFGR